MTLENALSRLRLTDSVVSQPQIAAADCPIPAEVVLHIFSFLQEQDLRRASLVCKSWCQVASDSRLWRYILARSYPEKVCYFEQTQRPQDWNALANHAALQLSKVEGVKLVTPTLDALPDSPLPRNVYIDGDGTIHQHAGSKFCTIRSTHLGKIALLEQNQRLMAYNLSTHSVLWQADKGETYLFSGGTNLGLGCDTPAQIREGGWRRALSQERQHYAPQESFSRFFFTIFPTQHALQYGFHLYDLAAMKQPSFTQTLPVGIVPQHVDGSVDGNFFVLTVKNTEGMLSHIAFCRKDATSFDYDTEYQVLAFDHDKSLAIVKSQKMRHLENPVRIIRRENFRDGMALDVELSEGYKAQLKANFAAVLTRESSLFIFDVNSGANIATILDPLPKHTIRSFSLYDDMLVLLLNSPKGSVGSATFVDTRTMKLLWSTSKSVQAVIGREAHVLICQTDKELITVNCRKKTCTKLYDAPTTAVYQSGILSTSSASLFGTKFKARSFIQLKSPCLPKRK